MIGDGEVTPAGLPRDPPITDSSSSGLVHGPHVAHAYTRRQLTGQDPLTSAVQTQLPETATDVPAESGRIRLPEPTEMGAIIGFQRSYDGGKTVYSYAAIKTPNGWYCTANNLRSTLDWTDLLDWIDAQPVGEQEPSAIWLAADWVEVR